MHIFLKNRAFRQLTVNEWISSFGDTIFYLAFINYVSSYAFAPLAIFLISLSETIPQVLQLFTGVIADFLKKSNQQVYFYPLYQGPPLFWSDFAPDKYRLLSLFCFLYLQHELDFRYDWFSCRIHADTDLHTTNKR